MHRLLFVLAILVFTTSCNTTPNTSKDLVGRTLKFSPWQTIPAHGILVNIRDLDGSIQGYARQRSNKRNTIQQYINFDDEMSHLWVEHVEKLYSNTTFRYLNEIESSRKIAQKWYAEGSLTYNATRKIYQRHSVGGYVHRITARPKNSPEGTLTECIVAMIGFLSDVSKHPNDDLRDTSLEFYDASLEYNDCSGTRTLGEIEAYLKNISIVSPGYNREKL